jgi:hypothetical protein
MADYTFTALAGYTAGPHIGQGEYGNVYLMNHASGLLPSYTVKIEKRRFEGDVADLKSTCDVYNQVLQEKVLPRHLPLLPDKLGRSNSNYPRFHIATKDADIFLACSMGYAPDLATAIASNMATIDTSALCLEVVKLHEWYKDKSGMFFFDANITNFGWFKDHVVFLELSDFYPFAPNNRVESRLLPQKFTLFRQQFTPGGSISAIEAPAELIKAALKDDYYFDLVAITPIVVTVAEIVYHRTEKLKPTEATDDPVYSKLTVSTCKTIMDRVKDLLYNTFSATSTNVAQADEGGKRMKALFQCVLYLLFLLLTPTTQDPFLAVVFPDVKLAKELWNKLREHFMVPISTHCKIDITYFKKGSPKAYSTLAEKVAISDPVSTKLFAGFADRCI